MLKIEIELWLALPKYLKIFEQSQRTQSLFILRSVRSTVFHECQRFPLAVWEILKSIQRLTFVPPRTIVAVYRQQIENHFSQQICAHNCLQCNVKVMLLNLLFSISCFSVLYANVRDRLCMYIVYNFNDGE